MINQLPMKYILYLVLVTIAGFIFLTSSCNIKCSQNSEKENRTVREQWRDAKFGLFVHWGPVSLKGTEIGWSRGREIPIEEYDSLYKKFDPTRFDAEEWVSLLKEAGMKYLVIVTKHHDGFVMWDSETTDYDIMSTPYKKDVIKQLSRECREQGILFGTYYSIADWWHPDYPLVENRSSKKEGANMETYVDYMKAQIKELVNNYHTKILWFDGEWEEPWTHEMGLDMYSYVKSLDDNILINNRVDKGRKGMEGITKSEKYAGDFATPEQQVGRFDTTTLWESCITIGNQWAWKPDDEIKSREECIRLLVQTAGGGGNLLLNVGPKPDGTIAVKQAQRLREIGDWLDEYGESVYGTRGGPLHPQDWGVSTQKGDQVYLHILEQKDNIYIENFPCEVSDIRLLNNNGEVTYEQSGNSLDISLSNTKSSAVDVIIALTCNK